MQNAISETSIAASLPSDPHAGSRDSRGTLLPWCIRSFDSRLNACFPDQLALSTRLPSSCQSAAPESSLEEAPLGVVARVREKHVNDVHVGQHNRSDGASLCFWMSSRSSGARACEFKSHHWQGDALPVRFGCESRNLCLNAAAVRRRCSGQASVEKSNTSTLGQNPRLDRSQPETMSQNVADA